MLKIYRNKQELDLICLFSKDEEIINKKQSVQLMYLLARPSKESSSAGQIMSKS